MNFSVHKTRIPDVLTLQPKVFQDHRGSFYESFNADSFHQSTGIACEFVQDNHSTSIKGVLRGLHYQGLRPQGKLIRVVHGCIYDVAVDIRRESESFGEWVGLTLSTENNTQLWVPPGFAHGFFVISDFAEVVYKTTDYYFPEHELSLIHISEPTRPY